MATLLTGDRKIKLSGSFDEYNMNVAIPFPMAFRAGKVLLPVAGNEFFTHINQALVVGTPVTIAAVVSGQLPILMGLRVAFSSATDEIAIRRIGGGTMFLVSNNYIGSMNYNFAPLGVVSSNVEHGLEVIQAAGTAGVCKLTCWGYYATAPA